MNHYQQHPDFYNQPIRLTEAEKAEPLETLRYFFQNCHFHEIRRMLWLTVETSLSAPNSVFDNAAERQTLLWFYREVETALEASLLLCEKGVYQEAKRPQPDRADATPYPTWKTKAGLEHEIRGLKIANLLQENELIQLRFYKKHGRMMTDK